MISTQSCSQCDEPIAADDAFCENCGASHRAPPSPCAECGGTVGEDGWCTVCGARVSNGRDHLAESPSASVAAVTDRGRLHARNEDAFALAVRRIGTSPSANADDGTFVALVVCDGVTTTTDSDVASFAAACAARDLLAAARRPTGSVAERQERWADRLRAAADAAGEATRLGTQSDGTDPPSCTFVAAVVDGGVVAVGWVGDSRAYWLPDGPPLGGAEQLTVDDSWAAAQIAAGVPRDVAEADRRAHAITKWLGADYREVEASTATMIAQSPGWLLVCSDGLWNYCSAADDMGQLVARQPIEALARAEALVTWANEQGGHDNITVALARIGSEE